MKNIWIAVKAWWIANTTNVEVWYVIYHDGRKTRRLSEVEASGLRKIYGGTLHIDWKYAKKIAGY